MGWLLPLGRCSCQPPLTWGAPCIPLPALNLPPLILPIPDLPSGSSQGESKVKGETGTGKERKQGRRPAAPSRARGVTKRRVEPVLGEVSSVRRVWTLQSVWPRRIEAYSFPANRGSLVKSPELGAELSLPLTAWYGNAPYRVGLRNRTQDGLERGLLHRQ